MRVILSLPLLLLLCCLTVTRQVASGTETYPPRLFMESTLDNVHPFVGQAISLRYTLYFDEIAPRIQDIGKPEHAGFWVLQLEPEKYAASTRVMVKGKSCRKAVIREFRLIPMQSGRLSVSNYQLRCLLPENSITPPSGWRETETVITAPKVVVNARPLPSPAPAAFGGAVGSFSLSVPNDRLDVRAGEPVELSVTVKGKGNLDTFPRLRLTAPDGFRRSETGASGEKRSRTPGSITETVTLIPEKTGRFRFSPITLHFFDPWKEQYETALCPEVIISVAPPLPVAPGETTNGAADPVSPEHDFSPLLFGMVPVALLSVIGTIFLFVRRDRSERPAGAVIADSASASHRPEPGAVDALRRMLYDALTRRGIMNPAKLTSQQLETALAGKLPDTDIAELRKLLAMIDRELYTPGQTDPERVESLRSEVKKFLSGF